MKPFCIPRYTMIATCCIHTDIFQWFHSVLAFPSLRIPWFQFRRATGPRLLPSAPTAHLAANLAQKKGNSASIVISKKKKKSIFNWWQLIWELPSESDPIFCTGRCHEPRGKHTTMSVSLAQLGLQPIRSNFSRRGLLTLSFIIHGMQQTDVI